MVLLEQVLDHKITSFEDIIGRLKSYEERVSEEEDQEYQNKLMYTNAEPQFSREYHDAYTRIRGRGGRLSLG